MYRFTHNQKHLADEFLANPFGRASPELQRVLIVFRGGPAAGKFVLVCTKPFEEWTLAQLTGKRGEAPKLLPEHRFSSLEDAERAVFRMRWREHTGHELRLMSVFGYSDRISVRAQEKIKFMVSCEPPGPFRADLVRVRCGDLNPAGPGYKEIEIPSSLNGEYAGRFQPTRAGSYVRVPPSRQLDGIGAFTIVAMLWPTTPGGREQSILSCWDVGGFELLLDAAGALALRVGDGRGGVATVSSDVKLRAADWCLVVASFDPAIGIAQLHQQQRTTFAAHSAAISVRKEIPIVPSVSGAPVLIAARNSAPVTAHYNGKINSPRIARVALPLAEALMLLMPKYRQNDIVAAWDFSQDIPGARVVDASGNGLHGEAVNLPARAMTGYAWNDTEFCWTKTPQHYGAIHFHEDDLYDAGWQPDLEFMVPDTLRSGCYALRLRAGDAEEYIPFFVRAETGRPQAKVLYLAQTATYLAYANTSSGYTSSVTELLLNRLFVIQPWQERLREHPEFGASLYDTHTDGSGICYSSRLRPILNMRPKVQTATGGLGSMLWAYNADTHLTDWLEASGFDFDVATDEDLDAEGVELLRHYQVVLTGTHPEYYSNRMLDALQHYTSDGGRLMYMGGNGFYWRVAYHPHLPGVMEVRRAEDGTRAWMARPGEYFHSFTGEYGGLWRRQDRAPQRLAGVGFIAQGFDLSSGYHRTDDSENPRVAFAFEGIERDAAIGDFGLIGGGAAGLEVDIVDPALGTPPHTLVVAVSDELPDTFLLVNEEQLIATPDTLGSTNARIRSDLAFFETPNGGAVFSFSSIAWCGSLAHNGYDNTVSRLTGNVLRRFMAPEPFTVPVEFIPMMVRRTLMLGVLCAAGFAHDVRAQEAESGNRVVCVSKQINEFIYAIGAEDDLVARDLTSIYPPQITKLPSVGYHRALSAEGIISMQPSVFLTDGNLGPAAVVDQIREVGIPIVIMDPGKTVDDAEALLTRLGKYFHLEDAAATVLAAWKGRMDGVQRDAAKWNGQPHPRVLMMHFGQEGNTYLALGDGGPAEQVIKWSGGENAFDTNRGMTRLTPEMIAQAAPDVIIATDVGFDRFGSAEIFAELPGVGLTPAGKSGRIFRVDETDLMYYGPRTPDAVTRITAFIHK